MRFFKGKITSSSWPYEVYDITTSSSFRYCQISGRGGDDWKPSEGDHVFCSEDEDGFCMIHDVIRTEKKDAPSTGKQIGDGKNGMFISPDGDVVVFRVDINSIRFNEEGVFLNYEALDEKGNGYIRRIKKADKDGAQNMETSVYTELKAPSQDEAKYSEEIKGTGVATGTVERTVKMDSTTGSKYEEVLDSDGNRTIKTFTQFMFGDGANEPLILGEKWTAFTNKLFQWLDGHVHSTPSGPSGVGLLGSDASTSYLTSERDASKSTKVKAKE
jgi:hypothetical protein